MISIINSPRLTLREFIREDSPFLFELMNTPGWLQFIGDRGIRTLKDAENYIEDRLRKSYAENGFGLWLVSLKENDTPIGMCGLVNRSTLPDIDIGFALLPQFAGMGYAFEAASATIAYTRETLGRKRLLAIASPENVASLKLLEKLGLQFRGLERLSGETTPVAMYAVEWE